MSKEIENLEKHILELGILHIERQYENYIKYSRIEYLSEEEYLLLTNKVNESIKNGENYFLTLVKKHYDNDLELSYYENEVLLEALAYDNRPHWLVHDWENSGYEESFDVWAKKIIENEKLRGTKDIYEKMYMKLHELKN